MIMLDILILTDYKGIFGSKQFSPTYRGGMDINLIVELFGERGYNVEIKNIFKIETNELSEKRPIVLYTSSEDKNGLYKSYIEDIIFHLEQCNYYVLPSYAYLKAHNNKVAMELLRERSKLECIKTIKSRYYGAIEELKADIDNITFPVVIKSVSGAMSRGVMKANNPDELIKKAKNISRSFNISHDIKEILRKVKYSSKYKIESFNRNKFIVQNFIESLDNDWKVLVYGNKCFVLYRGNRKNDFRASGSGKFVFRKDIPEGLLDYAYNIKEHYDVPHISLDVGYNGKLFHLLEFQFIYFGTTTLEKAPFYFVLQNNEWNVIEEKQNLENAYVESIIDFLKDS
jgi:glutathione synthase/RimK-type ligase-like ATP-grasp enzyme